MKNLKYTIGIIALGLAAMPLISPAESIVKASEEYPDFYSGNTTKGIEFVQSIAVLAPAYCSNIKGDVTIVFKAPGMTLAKAFCWQQTTKALAESSGYSLMFLPAYSPNLNPIEHL
jgi:hypothetical protein